MNHTLIHCSFSWRVWCYFSCESGIKWVAPGTVLDLIASWFSEVHSRDGIRLRYKIPFAIKWGIYLERNRRHFEGKILSLEETIISIKGLIFLWSNIWDDYKDISFEHFVFRSDRLIGREEM